MILKTKCCELFMSDSLSFKTWYRDYRESSLVFCCCCCLFLENQTKYNCFQISYGQYGNVMCRLTEKDYFISFGWFMLVLNIIVNSSNLSQLKTSDGLFFSKPAENKSFIFC